MGNLYIALVHYPVLDRKGKTLSTALTGIDLHDLARTARTFEVKNYFLITPLESQQEIARNITRYWLELNEPDETHRTEALQRVVIIDTLDASLSKILSEEGRRPLIIGTSARGIEKKQYSYEELQSLIGESDEPVYLLFGTGWGLAPKVIERVDGMLPPIYGPGEYNHLSVRAAVAITLDRLCGR